MAGKRNINRLRKAMNNNSVSSTVKKTADTAKKAASSAALSAGVKSGASAAKKAAQNAGVGSNQSYIKNSRLSSDKNQTQNKKKATSAESVMEKYQTGTVQSTRGNSSAANKAQFRRSKTELTKNQKSTLKENKNKYDKGLGGVSEGVIKRYGGSVISGASDTVKDVTNYMSEVIPGGKALKAGSSAAKKLYDNTVGKADKTLSTKNIEEKLEKTGARLQKTGQEEIDKAKEGRSGAAQWGIDLGTAAAEMGLDALLTRGRGTMGAMYARSYGSAKQSALDEGASEEQARKYGRAIGGLEAATEKMFAVAKPLKSLFGSGVADDVMETLLSKVANKAATQTGKNAAYHGGKTLAAAITEGLEEMVSEGLDPAIANTIYANALGTPHSTSAKDVLYAGSIGAAMGGVLGGAGQVVEYGQGRRVQNVFGEDGVKALAKAAKEVDDAGAAVKGSAINEMINRGEGIAAGQANELYKAVYEQEIKDLERNDIVNRSAERIMKRENLISPVTVDSRTGEMMVGKKTMESYTAQKAEAEKAINELLKEETDLSLPDLTKDQIASAVAAVQTGVAGVDEINLFTTGNPQARAVYESVTGKTLPKTNAGTREMLYRESGMNRVESARAETKSRVDEVKGLIGQDMGKYYESAGQEAFSQAFGDVNIGNAAQVDDMINTFDDFYRAGRNDIGYDTVISYQNPVHSNVSSEVKKAAWEAGQQDKILATETAKGLQMKIGETAKKNRSQRKMSAYKGRLYSELSNENKAKFTASQQAMLRALARVFNIDIHVVDAVENGANGYYKDGKMYISMEADRALEYVFAHEITHHMQQYAPEEYNELKELVRESWAQQGGIDEAVDFKVAQYAQHGVELSREDALDEILADSTYEVLQDETFVEELCRENRSIAQSILNAIKDVLKKLRSLLADGDRFTPAQNAQLLSNLDILKEFEKKWTDGLLRSVENRDAVGTVGTEVKVVKLSAKESKKDSIRLQIERNLGELNNMSPIANVKTKGYKGKSDKQVIDAVMANFKKRGYGVDRKGFGFISLEEEFINRSLNYLNTEAEYAAFDVLPQVLKNGKEIRDDEHKGRGHNTVTFAAPVVINGKAGIMGAVVMRTKGNRYKTHRIVMPDGSQYIFEQEKTEVTTSGMTGEKIHGEGPDIASAINDSISQTDKKDNGKSYSFKGIDDENVKYSIREDDPPKKTVKGYKVFVVKSGKLYPPMVANPGGADTPVGVWLDADEGVRAGESKTGRPQVKAGGKGTQGGSGKLAYRPGWHLGEAPMATQFARLNKETGEKELFPENFVWAECEAAADHDYQDEAMSYGYSDNGKFRHAYAGLPRIPKDGMYRYRTNPDPSTVPWIISGSMKVTKVLSDAEVDEILRSNATVSETAPEDKSKLWVDSSDGDTLKYWYGSKKEWRKAPVVRKGGKKTLEELGITNDTGSNATQFSLKDSDGRELSEQQQVKNIDNSNPTSDPDIRFSLKNEKLSPDARIPYTAHQSYISVKKNDNAALKNLQDSVRKLKRGTYENKATGYKADINRVTIGKILNPSGGNGFNRWSKKYIDNLNAATQLPELFENAVYVDTKENQKSKKANQQIQGYHHFVAPIYMDGKEYRVRIVAREKQNSDVLYIVETEIMPIKNGSSGSRSKASYFVSVPFDISIPELVNGVKIYDYNMQKNDIYNHNDIKYSMPDETSVIDYMNEQETEFADLTGFRDYEVKAKQVRQQTYGELVAQVEKLKNDKMFTKGKVLDERSVREEINDMIVTLMSYSESYNSLGVRKKTDHNLVREGVNAAKQIFTAMKKGDVSDVVTKAELAAQQIVENLKLVEDTAYVEYKDLRDYLRTTRMVISEEDAADIPDFKQFKKSNFGRIRIVSQNGIPVDTAYQELMERYPELFSDEITHPADMLRAIADVRESLEPYDIMLSAEETEQLVKQTAQDLIDIAATGKAWKSWADKKKEQYDEKLKMLKQRQREALRDVKKKERDRAEKKLEKERQKGKGRLEKAKEKNAEKLQREKDKAKEKAERQKDSKERKRLLAGIEQNRKWLSDRLSKPTDDKHIPEGFRTALADLLSKIDMQSQKSKALEEKTGQRARRWVEMDELKARFAEIAKEDGSGSFEYDGYVFEIMDSLAEKLGGRSVDEASTQELQEFDVLMKYIANGIKNYNKAFDESIKEEISQLALESVDSAKARQAKLKDGVYMDRSGILGGMDTILNESMVTPRDFFERIGGGLEKTFMGLRRGMDRHVDNMTKTREFFEGIFRQYNNKKKPGSKIEEWRDGKQVTTFDVQGGKIRLTPAQVMSLYCLAKREQAMGHILGSGIVASRVDSASKIGQMLGAKIQTGGSAVMIGMEDIVKITESMTQEQKAMADELQRFLNDECSQWGNEVSMRLYGYRKFTEENYFPIKSADAYLDSNFEGREVSERIKNFGFTKGTVVNANNPIMIDDIFSVVSDHINKMSLYNAFAAPISDFTRVYNYKSRDDAGNIDGSVKSAVEQAYGKKAINYISNFMADLNNQTKMHTDGILGFVNKSLANYKKSAIGGNLRVALQQPTAVARSFVRINPKYFANGKVNIAKNLRDMKEHCQIARWKSWGFSQVDMARDIDQIMMNNEWSRLDLATMQIYGFLDDVTWSTIWAAVRTETKAKYKNVQVDSEEFYRICNERASEIFDKTQVVDSVFHRSQAMRNKQVMSKMVTSFMAEPTRTFNMMRTEFLLAKDMWQEGNKAKAVGKMMRATSVFTFNAALCAGFAAAADALRGRTPNDDDDDSWLANFLANFWDNVNPLNMIPVVKDIWGYADGWDASNMAMEGWEKLVQGTMDFIQSPSTDGFLNMCDGLGYVTGLPVKNVRREFKSALKALGIESFAAEEGKEESADKKSIMDKIFGSFNIKDGSRMDNFLNHFNINLTDEEKAEKEYKDQVSEIEKDVKDLSGSEKEEKIWSEATKNYTKYIEDGDMESVTRCRRMLESLGGDVDKFDESVKSKVKTALKKNIGEDADPHKTWQYRNYLAQNGMNAEQISSEIVAKSDTAKEFQIALCMDDEDAAVDSLSYLIAAGISYEDMYALFVNRTKAIKASDFSTGEFAYPVSGEITSAFGGRESPGGIGSTDHKGIDIGVAMNSDVAAADGGKVTYAGWNGGYGYMVRVDHGNGRVTEYAHLNGYYVQKGQSVKKGEVIALSGSTGNSTGPHLHFGVKQNGTYVDPMIYF